MSPVSHTPSEPVSITASTNCLRAGSCSPRSLRSRSWVGMGSRLPLTPKRPSTQRGVFECGAAAPCRRFRQRLRARFLQSRPAARREWRSPSSGRSLRSPRRSRRGSRRSHRRAGAAAARSCTPASRRKGPRPPPGAGPGVASPASHRCAGSERKSATWPGCFTRPIRLRHPRCKQGLPHLPCRAGPKTREAAPLRGPLAARDLPPSARSAPPGCASSEQEFCGVEHLRLRGPQRTSGAARGVARNGLRSGAPVSFLFVDVRGKATPALPAQPCRWRVSRTAGPPGRLYLRTPPPRCPSSAARAATSGRF